MFGGGDSSWLALFCCGSIELRLVRRLRDGCSAGDCISSVVMLFLSVLTHAPALQRGAGKDLTGLRFLESPFRQALGPWIPGYDLQLLHGGSDSSTSQGNVLWGPQKLPILWSDIQNVAKHTSKRYWCWLRSFVQQLLWQLVVVDRTSEHTCRTAHGAQPKETLPSAENTARSHLRIAKRAAQMKCMQIKSNL